MQSTTWQPSDIGTSEPEPEEGVQAESELEPQRRRSRIPQSAWPRIIERYRAGATLSEIAREFECTPSAISYIIRRGGQVRGPGIGVRPGLDGRSFENRTMESRSLESRTLEGRGGDGRATLIPAPVDAGGNGDGREPHGREPRGGLELRDPRTAPEAREYRDGRDPRELREMRELRESREMLREAREPRDGRGLREPREPREAREPRESRELREPRDAREPRELRDAREPRELRDAREPRELRDTREPREPREAREPREGREGREGREPMRLPEFSRNQAAAAAAAEPVSPTAAVPGRGESSPEDVETRLRTCGDRCITAYQQWRGTPGETSLQELGDAVHEMRKVMSRLEIEMSGSRREERTMRPIPIPVHRAVRQGR